MMALLLEPLQFTFMSHALLISLVVSIPCALLSVFLVLKSWALMGDAMSHAVFPGIVLAWILGLPLATGAFVAGVFCAVATGYLKDNSRIKQDTVMGIVFSGMFAAGLILYIAVKPDVHLDHILFGDMLGITIGDIIQTMIIAGLVTLVISVKWRDFLLFSFDYQQAQASGLHTRWLHYGLLCMVSLTIVATLKAVGIILSISLLIAPGAIAVLLTQRFHIALLLATGISILVSMTGVWLSFFYRQRASSDNCCLIRGHVHHDVYRYQHQRTHKGKCRTTGFVIIRLAEHSASNIRLLAMRLNE